MYENYIAKNAKNSFDLKNKTNVTFAITIIAVYNFHK